jgi:hypothetical protein
MHVHLNTSQFLVAKSQEVSDPIKYRRVLVSTLLHAFIYDFTTFAECTGTDCK